MKQLQEPKQRPSVVALRADDELLVERAVERVLAQLDTAALREAMADVVTNLTKKVIAEEVGRIRRP
jgi:glutamyl-tRNA reductase